MRIMKKGAPKFSRCFSLSGNSGPKALAAPESPDDAKIFQRDTEQIQPGPLELSSKQSRGADERR